MLPATHSQQIRTHHSHARRPARRPRRPRRPRLRPVLVVLRLADLVRRRPRLDRRRPRLRPHLRPLDLALVPRALPPSLLPTTCATGRELTPPLPLFPTSTRSSFSRFLPPPLARRPPRYLPTRTRLVDGHTVRGVRRQQPHLQCVPPPPPSLPRPRAGFPPPSPGNHRLFLSISEHPVRGIARQALRDEARSEIRSIHADPSTPPSPRARSLHLVRVPARLLPVPAVQCVPIHTLEKMTATVRNVADPHDARARSLLRDGPQRRRAVRRPELRVERHAHQHRHDALGLQCVALPPRALEPGAAAPPAELALPSRSQARALPRRPPRPPPARPRPSRRPSHRPSRRPPARRRRRLRAPRPPPARRARATPRARSSAARSARSPPYLASPSSPERLKLSPALVLLAFSSRSVLSVLQVTLLRLALSAVEAPSLLSLIASRATWKSTTCDVHFPSEGENTERGRSENSDDDEETEQRGTMQMMGERERG